MYSEERELLETGRITFAKGKWLFSSEKVQDRCEYGSSFSFEKKLVNSSKLAKLQELFGKREKELHEE